MRVARRSLKLALSHSLSGGVVTTVGLRSSHAARRMAKRWSAAHQLSRAQTGDTALRHDVSWCPPTAIYRPLSRSSRQSSSAVGAGSVGWPTSVLLAGWPTSVRPTPIACPQRRHRAPHRSLLGRSTDVHFINFSPAGQQRTVPSGPICALRQAAQYFPCQTG